MNFTIERKTITAKPRTLKANWTVTPTIDVGFFYAPYLPMKMTYRQLLAHLHNNKLQYSNLPMTEQSDKEKEVMEVIQETMQANYPGPYVVEEYYDSKKMTFALRLKFESPQEETMWTIKNS